MLQLLKNCIAIGLLQLVFTPISQATSDKFRCIIRDEPSTTMTIGWNQLSGADATVCYGMVDFGRNAEKYPSRLTPQRIVAAKGMNNHFARLSNLRPNTVYYFVIQDSEGTSQRYYFRTMPDDHKQKLSIIAGGDSRNHRTARLAANKTVAKLRPDFVLFGGDMTGGDTDREWKEWFEDWQKTITTDNRIIPVVPARGNHEFSNQSIVDMFDVRSQDVYYALTFGRGLLRVYTLNSMLSTSGDQKDWLAQDLEANQDAAWRMAQYHHPMRPHTTRKGEHEYLRRLWAPLFAQFGVKLAVECDSHVAKVTHSVRSSNEPGSEEGFIRDDEKGTYFIGEGGWGAPLREADDAKSWTMGIGSFNQINWIFVGLDKMEVRTIKTDNIDMVSELSEQNRFTIPENVDVWKFNTNGVLVIPNQQSNFVAREAQNLMDFGKVEAVVTDDKVKLNWQAIYEMPNARFKIQVSPNKLFWKTVGIMQTQTGQPNNFNNYTFADPIPAKGGKLFYRIAIVDAMGNEKLKREVEVRTLGSEQLETVMASLASGQLLVDVDLPEATEVEIELFDRQRKRVFIQAFPYKKGKHSIPLNIKHLAEGFYLLEVSYNEQLLRKNIRVTRPTNIVKNE